MSASSSVQKLPTSWSLNLYGCLLSICYLASLAFTVPYVKTLLLRPLFPSFIQRYLTIHSHIMHSDHDDDNGSVNSNDNASYHRMDHANNNDTSSSNDNDSNNIGDSYIYSKDSDYYTLTDWVDVFIPVFLISIIIEFIVVRRRELKKQKLGLPGNGVSAQCPDPVFRFSDTINSLSLGVLQQLLHTNSFIKELLYVPYFYVWENFAIFRMEDNLCSWILCFIALDFLYYVYHRMGHECNVFWSAHVAHHSSCSYNLTTALRQGALQYSAAHLFYLPLALVFSPRVYNVHSHFNRIYQFFLHTQVVRRLSLSPILFFFFSPFLSAHTLTRMHLLIVDCFEYVFNSPSHHRAHHGANPVYIDCNYGGTLIVFDRVCDTFVREKTRDNDDVTKEVCEHANTKNNNKKNDDVSHGDDKGDKNSSSDSSNVSNKAVDEAEVVYGLTHNLQTWNPITCNTHHLAYMWRMSKRLKGLNKFKVFYKGPGWSPSGKMYPLPEVDPYKPAYNNEVSGVVAHIYIVLNFIVAVICLKLVTLISSSSSFLSSMSLSSSSVVLHPFSVTLSLSLFIVLTLWMLGVMNDGRCRPTQLAVYDALRINAMAATVAATIDFSSFLPLVVVTILWNIFSLFVCLSGRCSLYVVLDEKKKS